MEAHGSSHSQADSDQNKESYTKAKHQAIQGSFAKAECQAIDTSIKTAKSTESHQETEQTTL
jgi:hypothetical protein